MLTSVLSSGLESPEAHEGVAGTTIRRRRALLIALVIGGLVLQVAWRWWLSRSVPTPVAHADEDRYLITARALAGGAGGHGGDTETFRRMGYPLMLAPAYWFTHDPFAVYRIAQAIGLLVNALCFPLAWLFARRVLKASPGSAFVMAFLGSSLPAVVYYSEFTLTDSIMGTIGLAWICLLYLYLDRESGAVRYLAGTGAGAMAGFAYLTHVRGTIVLAVHCVLIVAVAIIQKRRLPALCSAVAAVVVAAINPMAKGAVADSVATGGIEPGGLMKSALFNIVSAAHTLADAAGQFWYLTVATGGLAAVATLTIVQLVRTRRNWENDLAQTVVCGAVLVTTALIAITSAAALPADNRVSDHVYFRYIAFLAPIWTMIGVWSVLDARRRGVLRSTVFRAFGLMAVLLLILLVRLPLNDWYHPFDTPEVSFLSNSWNAFRPTRAAVVAAGMLALWLLRGRWRWTGAAVLLTASLATMIVANVKAIEPMVAAEYLPDSRLVRDIGVTPTDTVETAAQTDLDSQMNHEREVYWSPIRNFDVWDGAPSQRATVVIAPWGYKIAPNCRDSLHPTHCSMNWDGTREGWARIYTYENGRRRWAVWLRESDPRLASHKPDTAGPRKS